MITALLIIGLMFFVVYICIKIVITFVQIVFGLIAMFFDQ
jgi:hypothetical protein